MADQPTDKDDLIAQLAALTSTAPHEARQYLEANQWNLDSAAAEYYTSLEEASAEHPSISSAPPPEDTSPTALPTSTGPRTLSGAPVPQPIPTTSSMAPSTSKPQSKKKFATLGDLSGGGGSGHAGHGHDDDSDDSDYDPKQDFFAGGEKSGLAVQNPDDLKKKILERARKNLPPPNSDTGSAPPPSRFTGTAHTLGGDDAPSRVIEDPNANLPRPAPPVERILHFWTDGFSVDDGQLYRSDDPANAEILALIKKGRAPMDILNVERNQEVEVKVEQHDEKYKAPKKKYKPFSGGGQRLGSPLPSATAETISAPSAAAAAGGEAPKEVEVDESQPTLSLQIRLGDGSRLVQRFNATHTIGDVYTFVMSSNPASQSRSFVLMTTFPSKELSDQRQVLGDLADFKRGGVVVQKWT
ncbi:MAG: hypothetical protein LQ351_004281 [Letrouitia transgressa]|nr:MAG: hypothetical protein LQ351_004281 [Letrouitia transgressa]